MIRRFGEPAVAGQKYRIRPGAYAVLVLGGDVLLTYQQDPEPEFQLPGGGIDPGESPIRALHREVFEETGWSIAAVPRRIGAFRGLPICQNMTAGPKSCAISIWPALSAALARRPRLAILPSGSVRAARPGSSAMTGMRIFCGRCCAVFELLPERFSRRWP
jgi:8-oxo-dGTP pyrophosphatase MutT (NUDIX family)